VTNHYLAFKFAHIAIAIVALGSGAAATLVPAIWASKLLRWLVLPGYLLMLVTGMWMGHLANLLDAHWAEAAMNLWGVGALFLGLALVALKRQLRIDAKVEHDPRARRVAVLLGRAAGAAAALVVLVILHFMVFKPA
jgi:hypothetical protein